MLERLSWSPLPAEESVRLARRFLKPLQAKSLDKARTDGRIASLPFYRHFKLVWIELVPPDDGPRTALALLMGKDSVRVLDGTSGVIHDANESEHVVVTAENVCEYVNFFCFFVHGDAGPFLIVERPAEGTRTGGSNRANCGDIEALLEPMTLETPQAQDKFRVTATMLYDRDLFRAVFEVHANGEIVMIDDSPLAAAVPTECIPDPPPLCLSQPASKPEPADSPEPGQDKPALAGAAVGAVILERLVKIMLDRALIAQAGHRLIAHFNVIGQIRSPIEQFAEVVATTSPVVAVESDIPFVEEVVARLVTDIGSKEAGLCVVESQVDASDETRLRVPVPENGPSLVLIPMHAYRGIVDAVRVAHELSTGGAAAIVGCERVADVPESIREIIDITLQFPAMCPEIFEGLFKSVVGEMPPAGWSESNPTWVTHVMYNDLEHPVTLGLTPEEALKYVRDRVMERMRAIDTGGAPGLKDLHGLGEARLFAEDLIADIRSAIAGRVTWAEVDGGVLFVGPPGTGKTTLARAIAKECGVKFVSASASSWQAAGHLGDHIRAIRADFSRTRRFAPAILFIDEIDSIGNRELLRGDNAQYQTEVVNALLEQLQGVDVAHPVVVIAATNHANRVDPALRRAGRLDRTIEIPYPSSLSLSAIFDHYLKPLADAGELAADVDTTLIGKMSLGLTGADVEKAVRGARRRARKAGRPLNQDDLLSEVTEKPRDPALAPRLTPEEVERVAVHEAGHALARCLSRTGGKDLTFVSIVPRANGSLGFVARAPSEKRALTRSEYFEEIEVVLAGRAAEEVRYGRDGVSSGADSDLRAATEICRSMIGRYGFGPKGSLVWSETEVGAHFEQIDTLLTRAYEGIFSKLDCNRKHLLAFAETLKEQQELTGPEVVKIIGITAAAPILSSEKV